VIGNPLQLTMLQFPFTADACVTSSALTADPTLTACLAPGYYPILLSSPIDVLIGFEISVACAPCEPVGTEASAWGGLKSLFR
jgi:hypothetical protein